MSEKKKFELVDTESVLFGPKGASAGNDLEKVGCYVIDLGKLVVKVAPQLPYNGERFRPTIRQIVDITKKVDSCFGPASGRPAQGF